MIDVRLKKKLKSFQINADFSFGSKRNVLFGISGSGKSSILKMIAGFFQPDEGFIRIGGRVIYESSRGINEPIYRRNVGYIPQEYTLFPHMTVKDNMLYGVRSRGLELDLNKFEFLINKTGLETLLDAFPDELSGGQKQRVSLVRALMVEPDILLLDEPFSALDKPIREELKEMVVDLVEGLGILTIFVSHDLDEAYGFAEELAVIEHGRIIQIGDKHDVFSRPKTSSIARVLGFKNIFSVDRIDGDEVVICGFRFKSSNIKPSHRFCYIRPEDVLILREDRDFADKENVIFATVQSIYERSDAVFIKAKSSGLEIFTKATRHVVEKMSIKKGKKIILSLKKEALIGGQ